MVIKPSSLSLSVSLSLMAIHTTLHYLLSISLSIITFTVLSSSTPSFSPIDHYLLSCGSPVPTTIDLDHRRFTSDSASLSLRSTNSIQLSDSNPLPNSSPIHHTARLFTKPSTYTFNIKDKGTHLVRLHFNAVTSSKFNIFNVHFHVLANGYVLLHDFSIGLSQNLIIKDYMMWVDSDVLEITFIPSKKSKLALINAIEVTSAPKDLIADVGMFVNGVKNERVNGLVRNMVETVYRVNVGGPKVTPFNDSLWRTWVPDDRFLKSSDGVESFYFGGRIKYQIGGASREVGPDNVYNTARLIRSLNDSIPDLNITWVFPVVEGYTYLVRMHFCDIASVALGKLYFNVYVNGNLAYENLDLTTITYELASPFYADFVVDGGSSGRLTVSVGPSNVSEPRAIDAILNGVEIMKMNNSMGSLDGEVTAKSILMSCRPKGHVGILVLLIASVCLSFTVTVVLQRRRIGLKDGVAWSPLPVEVSDVNLKYSRSSSQI